MNILSREDLTEKLNSLGSALNEKVAVFNLYPLFKKATSSSPEPTPGYIYDVLIEFSYKNKKNSELLGDYMNKRLQRHSAHGVLKTLKCILQLVQKGSRNFRAYLRINDEHIKNAPNFGCQNNAYTGTALLDDIKKLVEDILRELFLQSSIDRDSNTEPEQMPTCLTSGLSGMGNSKVEKSTGTKSAGKYEGFGNSPIDRSGVADSIRDVVESIMYAPDPKQELLEACLRGSTGQYEAAKPNYDHQSVSQKSVIESVQPKKHVPGRAGGGWEEEEEDSEDEFVEFGGLCIDTDGGDDEKVSLITSTQEFAQVHGFCSGEYQPIEISEILENTVKYLQNCDKLNILYSIKQVLDTNSGTPVFLALVLTEKLYQTGFLAPVHILQVLKSNLEQRQNDECQNISVKSAKLIAILQYLRDFKKA